MWRAQGHPAPFDLRILSSAYFVCGAFCCTILAFCWCSPWAREQRTD